MDKVRLTMREVAEIEAILSKGDRVEIMPGKDGVTVFHIKREKVKI